MNVYVESNFVLELALNQEEAEPARNILKFSQTGKIDLFIPAFSLAEPFWTMNKRSRERKESLNILTREQLNLSRSANWQELADLLGNLIDQTSQVEESEEHELEQVVQNILENAGILELSATVLGAALSFSLQLDLGMQDSIVFASVHEHLTSIQGRPKSVFISKDRKDFSDPLITDRLVELNCTYLSKFQNGLDFILAKS